VKRHREIASSPQRSAGEAWQVITELAADTLERSPDIQRADVEAAMAHCGGVGRMLIAGGHLQTHPLVLLSGELWLEITTVSGDAALTLDENLNPVPGSAAAKEWTLHLPACPPLTKLVEQTAKGDAHLSAEEPSEAVGEAEAATASLNEAALARWAREER
jgi:hypothetical protein